MRDWWFNYLPEWVKVIAVANTILSGILYAADLVTR